MAQAQSSAAVKDAVPSSPEVEKMAPASERVKTRQPFGGFTKKLDIKSKIPGYVLYWINDDPGRIPSCLNAGFEFVSPKEIPLDYGNVTMDGMRQNLDEGDRVSRPTKSVDAAGQPVKMYLMKLPQEFYEQDQAAKAARQAQIDNAIKGGGVRAPGQEMDKTYRPDTVGPTVVSESLQRMRPGETPGGMGGASEKVMTGLG